MDLGGSGSGRGRDGNGARMNDEPVRDAGQMLDAAALAEPVKLSAGKKRHALAKLAG